MNFFNKAIFFKSIFLIGFLTLLSKVFGVFKQQITLYFFSDNILYLDAYVAAFRIPNAFRELLAEGALCSAFVVFFSSVLHETEDGEQNKIKAFEFANAIILFNFILQVFFCIINIFLVDLWMPYYHHQVRYDIYILTVNLFKVFIFYLPIMSFTSIFMGILNAYHYYWIPFLGPIISNIAFLILIFIFQNNLGIYSLALATIGGGLAYLILQIIGTWYLGFRFYFSFDILKKNKRILIHFIDLFWVFAISMATPKISYIISNIYSGSIKGANTAISQAFFIIQLPISIFISGVSIVSLSHLSGRSKVDRQGESSWVNIFQISYEWVNRLTIPCVLIILFLSDSISRLIFFDLFVLFANKGNFYSADYQDLLNKISLSIKAFSPIIFSMGISILVFRIFQSKKAKKILLRGTSLSVLLNLIMMEIFIKYLNMKFYMIPLSMSISSYISLIYFLYELYKENTRFLYHLLNDIKKPLMASFVMILFIFVFDFFIQRIELKALVHFTITCTLILSAFFIYILSLFLLKDKVTLYYMSLIRNKIFKKMI